MARPKNNPDFNPEKAVEEMSCAVAAFYLSPESEEATDKNGHTKMKYMQEKFGLSQTKIRKLLVTAGVYEIEKNGIEMVSETAKMRERGMSDQKIMEELGISVGTLNSLTPYKTGLHNADFTADGYDMTNVSTDARRKRNQRKREKMRDTDIINQRKEGINEMSDKRTFMDKQKENYLRTFAIQDKPEVELDVEVIGDRFDVERYIHGKPVGDYVYEIPDGELYEMLNGEIVNSSEVTIIGFIDQNREKHVFILECYDLGPQQSLRLSEAHRVNKNGKRYAGQPETEYEFAVICKTGDKLNGTKKLMVKTAVALQNLTVERKINRGFDPDRAVVDGKYYYSAKDVGTIHVLDDTDATVYFQIDGKRYAPEDVVKLFSTYVGGNLIYQQVDQCDDVLEEDMTLMPMRIDADTLVQDLNDILFAMTDKHEGKLIRKKDIPAFDVLFKKIVEKLDYYYHGNVRDYGHAAADALVKRLKEIGSDDEIFPEYEIKMVQDAVKELWD